MISWMLIPFIIGLVAGVPISFALGIGVLIYILVTQSLPMDVLIKQLYIAATSFSLMAIPFFVLAGDLMNRSQITGRLVDFAKIIFGRIRGGLSLVMVFTATVFAGLTGSATADTAAMVKILAPTMEKEGYGKEFPGALAAACGTLGPIIPPSTIMIVYGATMNVSVGSLFIGGLMPGVIIAFFLMIVAYVIGVKRNFPKSDNPFSFGLLFSGFKDAALALIMPVIIIVGIRGGVFTPTEGGAVAVAYALILGFFVYKTLKFKDFVESVVTSGITAAVIMLVVGASNPFGWVLTINKTPQMFAEAMLAITTNPYVILFFMNILLLIVGMFLEGAAIVLLLAPILAPIAVSVGIDPIHFAVMMCVNVCIGTATPPVGVNLFVVVPIIKTTMVKISKEILPFIGALLVALILITYIPQVTLWLPNIFK